MRIWGIKPERRGSHSRCGRPCAVNNAVLDLKRAGMRLRGAKVVKKSSVLTVVKPPEVPNLQPSFDSLAADLRGVLDEEKDDDFKMAAIQALQVLELTPHRNNLVALQTLISCVTCYYDGDHTAARLLMFVSGALVNDYLCGVTITVLTQVTKPGTQSIG